VLPAISVKRKVTVPLGSARCRGRAAAEGTGADVDRGVNKGVGALDPPWPIESFWEMAGNAEGPEALD
jgi:hypothetical protein